MTTTIVECQCGARIRKSSRAAHLRTTRHATQLLAAAAEAYIARQDRTEHPVGRFDNAGRFWPDDSEWRGCCSGVREPSRSYPYSYMVHCRTMTHITRLYGVDEQVLRREVRKLRPPEHLGATQRVWFKRVAVVDGRFVSIFDGVTEYRLGKQLIQAVRTNHGGGFYVRDTAEGAAAAPVPDDSVLLDAPQVVLAVEVGGSYTRYDNGKVAFSRITPLYVALELELEAVTQLAA